MMPRLHCVEDRRQAIGCLLVQLVVQCVVDDVPVIQAFQLVTEMLRAGRDFFWQGFPG